MDSSNVDRQLFGWVDTRTAGQHCTKVSPTLFLDKGVPQSRYSPYQKRLPSLSEESRKD